MTNPIIKDIYALLADLKKRANSIVGDSTDLYYTIKVLEEYLGSEVCNIEDRSYVNIFELLYTLESNIYTKLEYAIYNSLIQSLTRFCVKFVKFNPYPGIIKIKKSAVDGYGVFAKRDIEKHTILEFNTLWFDTAHELSDLYKYTFDIEYNTLHIANAASMINHSTHANVIEAGMVNDKLNLITLRAITKGEELFLNYGGTVW